MTNANMLAAIQQQLDQLRTPNGHFNAGIPNYDHLFGRDSCVSALQLLHREPEVARATIEILAQFQGKRQDLRNEEYPGRILHEQYVGGLREQLSSLVFNGDRPRQFLALLLWRFPYYGSIDAGAWYMILLHHYVRRTGDIAFLKQYWPSVEGIMSWYDKHATHNRTGLVAYRRHYIFGIRNQGWKDATSFSIQPPVAMVEAQGYYYYAINLIADLADEFMELPEHALLWRTWTEDLRMKFHQHFELTDGVYPLAVSGRGTPVANISSNQGHLLFTGILDKKAEASVAERLFREDLITPYGVRNESMLEPTFNANSYQNGSIWPFDNWVIAQGLKKTGYTDKAAHIKAGIVKVFEHWGNLPELYTVERDGQLHGVKSSCRIQAWSAGALINLLDEAPLL